MTVNVSKPAINVREKLAELDKPTGIAGEAMLRAETPQEQFNLIGAGRRNLLINGDFQVSQRGNYSSATSVGNAVYYIDRWKSDVASTVNPQIVHSDVTLPNNQETKSFKITATTGNSSAWMGVLQTVEDYKKLSNQTVTMSGWVKTNNPYATFRHTNDQDLGESFIPDGQWHYYSRTIKLGAVTGASNQGGASWGVVIYNNGTVNISANDYIEMAQVQLELGKVATPFEHRSYGEELALCQRYYYRLRSPMHAHGCWQYSTNSASTTFRPPVTMRTKPTFTRQGSLDTGSNTSDSFSYYTNGWVGLTSLTFDTSGSSADSFRIDLATNQAHGLAKGAGGLYFSGTASLDFDAEL